MIRKISFMYATQCVPFVVCKLTIPISLGNGSSLDYVFTSLRDKEERIYWIFIFDVALFFNLFS